jgi:hypothetical protein
MSHDDQPNRLRNNSVDAESMVGGFPYGTEARITSGCSKRPSSKAAASKEARRTLRYVEPLREARTPLADFFSILLRVWSKKGEMETMVGDTGIEPVASSV